MENIRYIWVTSCSATENEIGIYSQTKPSSTNCEIKGMIFLVPRGTDMEIFKEIHHEGKGRIYIDQELVFQSSLYISSPDIPLSNKKVPSGAEVCVEMILPRAINGCTLILVISETEENKC